MLLFKFLELHHIALSGAMGANKVVQKSKEAKMKAAMAGGKSKKKKWAKGKVKEKLANMVMFDTSIHSISVYLYNTLTRLTFTMFAQYTSLHMFIQTVYHIR